jgi:hypothetical protein
MKECCEWIQWDDEMLVYPQDDEGAEVNVADEQTVLHVASSPWKRARAYWQFLEERTVDLESRM